MADSVSIQLGAADLGRELLDELCALYDEVFSQPPFFWLEDESQLHRDRLLRLLTDSTFGLVVARDSDDELVGFAYGFTLSAETKRWQELSEPLPADAAAEWPGRTFVLFDYAVRAAVRGQGVGRRLHDQLLASRGEQRATLTVQPTAVDTQAIYRRWGWRKVGQLEGGPGAAAPVFDVYLRDRLDDLKAAQPVT